jgi:O-antigen/teichoic acid export membrane protein
VVLARLLTPEEYGLFAVALSVQLAGQQLAELGLPAALVRLEEEPGRRILAAVSGLVLLVTTVATTLVSLTAFLVLPAFGAGSELIAIIGVTALALPLYAFRSVPMAMMERGMSFGKVAGVEAVETLAFNTFALLAALLGLGAFSLAGAVPFAGLLGAITAWLLLRTPSPRLDLGPVRPLIGFGSRVSLLGLLYMGKEVGMVALISLAGGVSMAGFYAMAKRLFSFPTALAGAVSRVSFPALMKSKEHRPRRTARLISLTALVCGLPLALVAGAIEPLITVILGENWLPTKNIVLYGSLSLFLTACVSGPVNSFFLAEGRPNIPILATVVELCLSYGAIMALVGTLGATGVGIALSLGSIFAAGTLLLRVDPEARSGFTRAAKAMLVVVLSAATGHLLDFPDTLVGLGLTTTIVTVVWTTLTFFTARDESRQALGMVRAVRIRIKSES